MRIRFQDGVVYAHDEQTRALLYVGTPEELALEVTMPQIELPQGMAGWEYREGPQILVYFDDFGNAFPREGATPAPAPLEPLLEPEVLAAAYVLRIAHEEALVENESRALRPVVDEAAVVDSIPPASITPTKV